MVQTLSRITVHITVSLLKWYRARYCGISLKFKIFPKDMFKTSENSPFPIVSPKCCQIKAILTYYIVNLTVFDWQLTMQLASWPTETHSDFYCTIFPMSHFIPPWFNYERFLLNDSNFIDPPSSQDGSLNGKINELCREEMLDVSYTYMSLRLRPVKMS